MVKKYKITYWQGGNKKTLTLQASSIYDARLHFYLKYSAYDIASIEEVKGDV
jgi:hypothetical protein